MLARIYIWKDCQLLKPVFKRKYESSMSCAKQEKRKKGISPGALLSLKGQGKKHILALCFLPSPSPPMLPPTTT